MKVLTVVVDSASYDEPEQFVVSCSPRVNRAIQHLQEFQDAVGDGSVTMETTEGVDASEVKDDEFIEFVINDTSSGYEDEVREWIETGMGRDQEHPDALPQGNYQTHR